ncbi:hypothetical protein V8E53_003763 [Lactarius tabidus]
MEPRTTEELSITPAARPMAAAENAGLEDTITVYTAKGMSAANGIRYSTTLLGWWEHNKSRPVTGHFISRLLGALYQEGGVRVKCLSVGDEVTVYPKRDDDLRNWSFGRGENKEKGRGRGTVNSTRTSLQETKKDAAEEIDGPVQSELTVIGDWHDSRNEGAGACERVLPALCEAIGVGVHCDVIWKARKRITNDSLKETEKRKSARVRNVCHATDTEKTENGNGITGGPAPNSPMQVILHSDRILYSNPNRWVSRLTR